MASRDKVTPGSDGKFLEKPSSVAKYEALLLEVAGPGLSEERVSCVFQILDQLQPHMGVFKQVMKRIRDELFDAVYSEQYTGARTERISETSGFIQRIPYFALIKKVHDERHELAEELREQLDMIKKRLFEKQREYETSQETVVSLGSEIDGLQHQVQELQSELATKKLKIINVESKLGEERENTDRLEYNLQCDLSDVREELEEAQTEAAFLRRYKGGYDELEAAFLGRGRTADDGIPKKKKKAVVATKRAHLLSGIESALKLEEQILTVQNLTIEDFDKFMEGHKVELTERSAEESIDVDMFLSQQAEIGRTDQELMAVQARFQRSMEETRTELELLQQHRSSLQEQLDTLSVNRPQLSHTRSYNKKTRRLHTADSVLGDSRSATRQSSTLSVGGAEVDDPVEGATDPFVPQERIFSKYAAMMYTSDTNGKSYHEFKDARYCSSCGEKTVLCPHKILSQEHVLPLPPGSTHLKISRPKVRINYQAMDTVLAPGLSDVAMDTMSLMSAGKPAVTSRLSLTAGQFSPTQLSDDPQTNSLPVTPAFTSAPDSHLVHPVQRLWEDFRSRAQIDRSVPRQLSQGRAVSLIEQFAAHILWQDDFSDDDDDACQHILDNVYSFLLERYLRMDVMYLAMHDFISAIIEYSPVNKILQLFLHVLIGNYDGTVFRYLLLMCDFIDQVEWHTVEDFRAFASAVYPFLNDDDLETLHMGYTAFSENKVCKRLVMAYVIYIILKYREPRFLEMETKLLNQSGKEVNVLTEAEFAESADAILPVSNDRLRHRLYAQAELYVSAKDDVTDGVPILRLAQITSYLELLQIAPVVKETVIELVTESRDRPSSARTATTKVSMTAPGDQLPTITAARKLALSIDRRMKCRQMQTRDNMMS